MDSELFVQNVKKYCHAKGELPTIACKKAGVGGSFISDINRGRTPSVEKVHKLADYLGVTTSELLGETIPATPGGENSPAAQPDLLQEWHPLNALEFVQNIKKYCELKNVKPTVACRESGVGTSFINNIEKRGSMPSVEKVKMLADYLGVTTSELLGELELDRVTPGGDKFRFISKEKNRKKATHPPDKADLQAAFWGGEKDLSQEDLDAMWDDVERFAQFLAEKKRQEKQNND